MSDLNFLSFDSGGYAAAGGSAQGVPAGGAGGFDGGPYGAQPGGFGGGMMMGGPAPPQPGYPHQPQQHQGFAPPPMSVPVSGTIGSGSMSNSFGPSSGYGFDDEPPLLEELGIDLGLILRKSTAMLRPHGLPPETLLDGDLIGPVFFCLLLATAHLLAGKVLFGYVLGWSLVSSFVTSTVLGMLTPASDGGGTGAGGVGAGAGGGMEYGDGNMGKMTGIGGGSKAAASNSVEFGMTTSLLGYSMLPMVGGTVIASLIPRGPVPTAVVFLCVLWSARTCSSLMTIVTPSLKSVYWLVLYPCILFYSVYALLALY